MKRSRHGVEKICIADKLALITEHWRPKVVAALNGQEVKLVKFQGSFAALVFEPADTRNTGNVVDERLTAPAGVRI